MNEKRHWNQIGSTYNDVIFDVFANDRKKLLPHYFKKHKRKNGTALDFGCGNGKAFQYLTPLFHRVIGADISRNLLQDAAKRGFKNVELLNQDLSKLGLKLPKVDFIFSCNVIMLPEAESNYQMLNNIARALREDAHALLVVPSTESMMYASWMLTELYRKEGVRAEKIPTDELGYFQGRRSEIASGVFYIDDVPTRHYSAPQLEVMLHESGLQLTALQKMKYDWDTELADPPKNLKGPYPWDWLVECRRAT